ncbi:hypothetical protein DSO57_1031514 [Entomophthora muscae]|uniref:Uncharacterized protein n=1 Tax=Entomophthora muscae TaxID=34485 RepID=A0ACC2ULD8_9FUNG|nr:hypothetical protein DSO57_1031514 [Entomophthora muscae]
MKLNTYMATKLTTKNLSITSSEKDLLEESTWELLSNLTNAQEAIQLYLNKKNWKGGPLGEEVDGVKIDNYSSLETQARELESNPKPRSLWATGPVDRRITCPRFFWDQAPTS